MHTRLTTFTAIALTTAALIGCGGDDDVTGPSAAQTASTSAATEETGLPEPIAAQGAESVELSDRLRSELEIPEAPDWMVAGFGSLWVKLDNGGVLRVDPKTGKEIAHIGPSGVRPPGGHLCQGIGASANAIWACPGAGAITRIDPATNSVAATVRIDKLPDQGRLVSAAGHVWVLTDAGAKLTAIYEGQNRPSTTIRLGGRCADLAAAGMTLWALCPLEDRVLRIDAKAGEVSDELALPGAANAFADEDLWVAFEGGLAQIDPRTLEVLAVYDIYPRYGGAIFATGDSVWVRLEGGPFLTRIDPRSRRVVETIKAPRLPSGGDVVQIKDWVWATAYNDEALVQLRASRP
jgi:streptogramin lyase